MLLMVVTTCALCDATSAQQLTADQEKRIGLGINLIKLGCGTGASREKAQIAGTGDMSLSLKKLPGATVGGNFEYSNEEAQGLATALQKEISTEGVRISEVQLECMKPYIDKIFNVLFPDQVPPPKSGEPTDGRHGKSSLPASSSPDPAYRCASTANQSFSQQICDHLESYRGSLDKLAVQIGAAGIEVSVSSEQQQTSVFAGGSPSNTARFDAYWLGVRRPHTVIALSSRETGNAWNAAREFVQRLQNLTAVAHD